MAERNGKTHINFNADLMEEIKDNIHVCINSSTYYSIDNSLNYNLGSC